jgi:ABC-type spermidine/putrescine transport system permease subunit II
VLTGFVSLTAVVLTAPTLILIPMSFSSGKTFAFPPPGWSLKWYKKLFDDPSWLDSIVTSFKAALISAPLATVIGTAAAFGLARMGPRLRGALTAGVLAPLIVPHILVALAAYSAFLKLQLNGTLRGLVLVDTVIVLPFVIISVMTRLQGFDPRMRDAALGLGAPPRVVFTRVTLPLMLPGILSGALLAFITAFDEFIIALLLQGPDLKPLPIKMYDSVALEIDPTISPAATIIVVLVSIVILTAQLVGTRTKKVDAAT